jgi:hypothetical protein
MSVKPYAILCDIDGTIALKGDRDPYDYDKAMEDAVNWPVVKAVERLSGATCSVFLVSGRDEECRDVTEYWLRTHDIFRDAGLLMRPHKDNRSDEVVKEELYRKYIEPFYTVQLVFDDRNRVVAMWRRIGLTCFQVAEGDF